MRCFLTLLLILLATQARADSFWNMLGLTVRLEADGNQRHFVYTAPFEPMSVTVGGTVFRGRKVGNEYVGTSYAWTKNCKPVAYPARGPISEDQRTVTIAGKITRLNAACQPMRGVTDTIVLTFNFIDPNAGSTYANQTPAPATPVPQQTYNTEVPYTGDLVVCLLPVPRAILNLGLLAKSRPEISQTATQEANYLLTKYCRKVTNPTFAAMGAIEGLGDYCMQMSGILKGDQVYWTVCNPKEDQLE